MYNFFNYFNEYFDLFFLAAGLIVLLFIASNVDKRDRKVVGFIIGTILLLSITEYCETLFDENFFKEENFGRYLFSTISYILRPTVIVLFYQIKIKKPKKIYYLIWLPCIINALIYILALFAYHNPSMRLIYWFTEANVFDRTFMGLTVYAVSIFYLLFFIGISLYETFALNEQKEVNIIVIIAVITTIISAVVSICFKLKYTYLSDSLLIALIFYYMYISYEATRKTAVMHEREMQEKTTALMLSQIQPHFVYNTLATIRVLCDIDPELAGTTIEDFSKYLRVNTDALNKKDPVPIMDEVNHAKAYSKIEMLRFDNIEVRFEIEDEDFNVPVLTIQPMLENAIKYGVRGLEHGLVEIKTYKDGNNHILIIKDNGKGFDVNSIGFDGKNHVGVGNVKTRIINMVNGTFNIESEIGKGTIVTITIPEVK